MCTDTLWLALVLHSNEVLGFIPGYDRVALCAIDMNYLFK